MKLEIRKMMLEEYVDEFPHVHVEAMSTLLKRQLGGKN